MKEKQLDAYVVLTADPHNSEYLSEYFRERAWLTGFTGSAGQAVVTMDKARVWADGRYFIQCEKQIQGSEFEMLKIATPGFPTVLEWLFDNLPENARVGVGDAYITEAYYEQCEKKLSEKKIELVAAPSLIDEIWTEGRPALPSGKIFHHAIEFTGLTAAEKIDEMREKMKKDRIDAVIMVGLDDLAWLFNYRGSDVPCNPVVLAYTIVTLDEAMLFMDLNKVDDEMKKIFKDNGVQLFDYDEVDQKISELKAERVGLNKQRVNRRLYSALPEHCEVVNMKDYPHMMKAVLNDTELACQRECLARDSAVVTSYLMWIKRNIGKVEMDELSVADRLHEMRASQKNYIDESFGTISAYGANAAMMHYAPTPENYSKLEAKSFYLCDCGGQYFDGTTDITRTIALGELTDEEKTDFTLVLKSHIALAKAIFLKGCTGFSLDILAREELWKHHLDYKCGTGHAVGYVSGCHEGPHGFSCASRTPNGPSLVPHMMITNEPGIYKEGKHGIRLENDYIVVVEAEANDDTWYTFEALSLVPFDRDAIKVEMLNEEELDWLNRYHAKVLEEILPRLESDEDKEDLKKACAAL